MEKRNFNQKSNSLKRQPLVLYLISSVSFLLILFRLIFLQLISYDSFKKMSDQNRIRLIATQPIRGRIIDKNGFVLADSRLRYSLIVKPQYVSQTEWQKNRLMAKKSSVKVRLVPESKPDSPFFIMLKNLQKAKKQK